MRCRDTVRATLVMVAGLATNARAQGGASFTGSTIDQGFSGDCKAIGDLDGDGLNDAIVGGPALYWFDAGAAFARRTIRSQPVYGEFTTDMQAVDIDGDTDIDIVVGDGSGADNVLWFVNPRINPPAGVGSDPQVAANWTYRVIGSHGATVHDIEVADLDQDGLVDVVTSGHGQTHLWKQISPASWIDRNISSVAGAGVSIGDIDRDGFPDIGTPNGWIRNPQSIMSGTWTFSAINQANSGDECLVADFSGDGRLDLMTCEAHSRGPMVWFEAPSNPTSGTWTKRTIDPAMGAHHPEAADFDRNGRMDILMGLELQETSVYMNDGGNPASFVKVVVATGIGHNSRAGDMNGDLAPDILACDYINNPPVQVYINHVVPPVGCWVNCDGSSGAPLLTSNDFQCFLDKFAAGDSFANCDGTTSTPTLTSNDFQCFLDKFAAGCT